MHAGRLSAINIPYFLFLLLLFIFPTAHPEATTEKPPIPEEGLYVGALLLQGQTTFKQFNTDTGIRHAIFGEFLSFPNVLDTNSNEYIKFTNFINGCMGVGAIPMLTLEVPGGLNSYTVQQAEQFADFLNGFNTPLFLRWNHEMNGSWYPWGQQPTLYIAKFREFANIIHQHAPSVAMTWTPNQGWGYPWAGGTYSITPSSPDFALLDTNNDEQLTEQDDPYGPYYPGDEFVDWVGMSFYHWSNIPARGYNQVPYHGKWEMANGINNLIPNFHDLFAVAHNKPMMIAETSALYDPLDVNHGGASELDIKKEWIRQVYNLVDPTQALLDVNFPQLKAICWFNQLKYESEVNGNVDWRLNDNLQVTAFYNQVVTDEYFIKALYNEESVTIESAPTLVEANQTFALTVQYTATVARDIELNLLNPAGPVSYGTERVSVAAGQGSVTLHITIQNGTPLGDTYVWDAIMIPTTGNGTQILSEDQKPVSVVVDSLSFISPPSILRSKEEVTLFFNYTAYPADESKQLRVSLLDPTDNWAFYGMSIVDLPEGTGSISMPFTVQGLPPPGSQYVLDARIVQKSNDWTKSTVDTQATGITVIGDSIKIKQFPLSVERNEVYKLVISYSCDHPCYMNISLLHPSSNSTWGEVNLEVGPGAATLSIPIKVSARLPSRQDYAWSAILSDKPNDSQSATAANRVGPISTTDAVNIVSAPEVLQPNQTYAVKIAYSKNLSTEKYVHVRLLDSRNLLTWYGSTSIPLPTNQTDGEITVNLLVERDPPEGFGYLLSAFIVPKEQDYTNATAKDEKLTSIGFDELKITAAPKTVASDEMIAIKLNYNILPSLEGKSLSVKLLSPKQNYASLGGRTIGLLPGNGELTVRFPVRKVISGKSYIIDATVSRDGLDKELPTAQAQCRCKGGKRS